MSARLRDLIGRGGDGRRTARDGRGRGGRARSAVVPGPRDSGEDFAGRVRSELAADLPDEDLGEELTDCLDMYEMGSKPRCEEVEYLDLVQEAIDRIDRGC
ncbi:hypothetical protein [Streptomyces sp. bgisy100]|uniref:hypothetical protein n=1 Tax=Streptomyces sp. bgisy100 TaxID=3413783 RepID=UPI003D706306